jgi:hypothetical protein
MRRTAQRTHLTSIAIIVVCLLCTGRSVPASADTSSAPSLVIAQVKITSSNGQFITLYNTTGTTLDMSRYQLEYFNNYEMSKATSSRLIALSGIVPPHGYYMVNDSALQLCHQVTVNSVSLGLSSTSGFIGVIELSQATPGGIVYSQVLDYVGWSKTAAPGAQTLPANTAAFLLRRPADANGNPLVSEAGTGGWLSAQPDTKDPCSFVSMITPSTPVATGLTALLPAIQPDVTFREAPIEQPIAMNAGLMAPLITELLPNPAGTGTDGTDEFIEIYNPNGVAFDLSGHKVGAGSSTVRTYTFPTGTLLRPKSYSIFSSSQTKLSMSNTGGQVILLDNNDQQIAATKPYVSAADGIAWVLAKGTWVWSAKPTPGSANIVQAVPVKKKSSSISNKKIVLSSQKTSKLSTTAAKPFEEVIAKTPIHTWALALVGAGALVYGLYEYRQDFANRLRQLRGNLSARQKNRQ